MASGRTAPIGKIMRVNRNNKESSEFGSAKRECTPAVHRLFTALVFRRWERAPTLSYPQGRRESGSESVLMGSMWAVESAGSNSTMTMLNLRVTPSHQLFPENLKTV